MIEKPGICYNVTCDFCPEAVDTGETDFRMAVAEIKSQGWQVFKKQGEWHHRCPACVAKDKEALFDDERV